MKDSIPLAESDSAQKDPTMSHQQSHHTQNDHDISLNQLGREQLNSEMEDTGRFDSNEEPAQERIPNDGSFPVSVEDVLPDRVVNFPNGNSSSAFPDLSPAANAAETPEDIPEEMQTSFDFGELQTVDNMGNPSGEDPQIGTTLLDATEEALNTDPNQSSQETETADGPSSLKNIKVQERRNRAEEINVDNAACVSVRMVPKFQYTYHQTEDFPTELREWFLFEDNNLLYELRTQYVCSFSSDWRNLSDSNKKRTLEGWIENLDSEVDLVRNCALSYIAYVALGSYATVTSTGDHITQIKTNTKFLWKHGILSPLYKMITRAVNSKVPKNLYDTEADGYDGNLTEEEQKLKEESLNNQLFVALTAMYFIVESNRDDPDFVEELGKLHESILLFIVEAISRLRWVIEGNLPLRPMLLLFWKCVLCLFGDENTFEEMKKYMLKKMNLPEQTDEDLVMASPLDYHAFRQDIISRYPSYVPPSSILPENFDNTRSMTHFIEVPRPIIAQTSNSALPVPTVHIATPAPSPPSSPAIAAGQKVRKSVFMTNQSFPFIHPTDENIPQSIIEASELFHSRIKTTPGMVQLWEERDKFMQQERGWVPVPRERTDFEESQKEEAILERIEKFYIASLPHLNSFVLVVLKFLLANISFITPESHIDTYLSTNNVGYDSRAKDIGLKSVSSVILALLEWFEVSHICKLEYLSSLLFDSRYYLVVFKYFYLHTPIEKALQILDSPNEDFFRNCKEFSRCWDEEKEEEYLQQLELEKEMQDKKRKEELGDSEEIRNAEEIEFTEQFPTFSNRYFLTTINLLRILRKIIQKKTQRVIVVAELPPDTLKKTLSIFQPDIWTTVLEIFKEQVPYNGRKWRSTNMDLVSAIYLHCKTKLRDDWLINGDPNAEVEDAQPQEIAIRALIQFYNERIKREVLKIHAYKKKRLVDRYEAEGPNGEFEYIDQQDITDSEDPPDFFSLELDALALGNMPM